MAILSLYHHDTASPLIAWTLAVDTKTVDRHIAGFRAQAPTSLSSRPRPAAVPLTVEQQSILIAFYCQSSPPPGMQRWTLRIAERKLNAKPDLLGRTVHHSTIGRVLRRHQLRPHRIAYFLHIRDPMFFEKMYHILRVYAMNSEHIYCFDECPNIQAISRRGPDVPERNGSTSPNYTVRGQNRAKIERATLKTAPKRPKSVVRKKDDPTACQAG